MIPRFFHLVLLREVQPQLRHLERASGLLEVRGVELLVDDTSRRGHPLDVARADAVAVADGIAVLHLALPSDGDRLETSVGMLPDAAPFVAGLELLGRGVVEHQPRGEFLRERLVVKHGEDVEAVADPVPGRCAQDLTYFLVFLLRHAGGCVYRSVRAGREARATEGGLLRRGGHERVDSPR